MVTAAASSVAGFRVTTSSKIDAADGEADGRHDDVIHQRFDDRESAADDDADRHVDHIALEGEVLKLKMPMLFNPSPSPIWRNSFARPGVKTKPICQLRKLKEL
ncbi:MAG: hypothetical protein R3C54_03745 [Parvularculaceae bacterium]